MIVVITRENNLIKERDKLLTDYKNHISEVEKVLFNIFIIEI